MRKTALALALSVASCGGDPPSVIGDWIGADGTYTYVLHLDAAQSIAYTVGQRAGDDYRAMILAGIYTDDGKAIHARFSRGSFPCPAGERIFPYAFQGDGLLLNVGLRSVPMRELSKKENNEIHLTPSKPGPDGKTMVPADSPVDCS